MIRCTYVLRALRAIDICAVCGPRDRLCTPHYVTMETPRRRPPAAASIAFAPAFACPPHDTFHNISSIYSVKLTLYKFRHFIQRPIRFLNIAIFSILPTCDVSLPIWSSCIFSKDTKKGYRSIDRLLFICRFCSHNLKLIILYSAVVNEIEFLWWVGAERGNMLTDIGRCGSGL